uniref:Tryptophanyl-tRNA synthetase n=1 Tax=Meloidogyne javanica TaxID=6303 RepID=A0A915MWQ3_MELJA
MHALSAESLQTWAILLSTGVDPFRTIIVQQSRVPELTELMWILGTATTLPSLTGLSQFKDKSKSLKAVSVGLATYPLLQAADVLEPIRGTYHQLLSDESTLWEILENGGKRARQIVTKTLEDVKTIVGFR